MIFLAATRVEELLIRDIMHPQALNMLTNVEIQGVSRTVFMYGYYKDYLVVPRYGGSGSLAFNTLLNCCVELELPHRERIVDYATMLADYSKLEPVYTVGRWDAYYHPTENDYAGNFPMRVSILRSLNSQISGDQILQGLSSLYPTLKLGKDYKLTRIYTTGGLLVQKQAEGDGKWESSNIASFFESIINVP